MSVSPAEASFAYPKAGPVVSGLEVLDDIPGRDSIAATFDDWEVLQGIREIALSEFDGPHSVFVAKNDFDRSRRLADAIQESGQIKPLIIVVGDEGPYILEGAHRYVALFNLGVATMPALLVLDKTAESSVKEAVEELRRQFRGADITRDQAHLVAGNLWFNLEDARKQFQTREAFQAAVSEAIAT